MKRPIKAFSTAISTVGLILAGFVVPAQAAGPEITLINTNDTLQGSSISGNNPLETLTLSVLAEAGNLSWADSGTSGAVQLNTNSNTSQGLFFTGTQDQISAVLNEISILKPCAGAYKIHAQVTNTSYMRHPITGHLYKSGGNEKLDVAMAAAQYTTLVQGETNTHGYVATVTDGMENSILATFARNNEILLSATDRDVEGDWKWVAGPETGQSFYLGDIYTDGATLPNKYSAWRDGEPNDSSNEDFLVTSQEGLWNDISNDSMDYVIEFGGMPGDDLSSVSFSSASLDVADSEKFAGLGTEASPFLVPDAIALRSVEESCGSNIYYKQTADITLPVAWTGDNQFAGHYNGDGHTITYKPGTWATQTNYGIWGTSSKGSLISNLNVSGEIYDPYYYRVGLLVGENNGSITDVNVDGTITTALGREIGGVVGGTSGKLTRVHSTVDIIAVSEVEQYIGIFGGIAGYSYSRIEDSSWNGSINITGGGNVSGVGGIVGSGDCMVLMNSSSVGSITITSFGDTVGGAAGFICGNVFDSTADVEINAPNVSTSGGFAGQSGANLTRVSALGDVRGDYEVGGLVGVQNRGVANSYARGNVIANETAGSLLGVLDAEAEVISVYATGSVTSALSRGLFGRLDFIESMEGAHWVVADSTIAQPETLNDGEVPFTAEEAKSFAYYLNDEWVIEEGWTGSSIWSICSSVNDGYPFLGLGLTADPCVQTQTLKPTPTIAGSGVEGSALTGVPGTWDTGVTLAYAWLVDGQVVAGSVTTTYTPQVVDVTKTLTFRVTSTRSGYVTVVNTSVGLVVTAKPVPPVVPPVVKPVKPGVKTSKLETVVGGFAGNAWWIPTGFVASIKATVKSHSKATTVICTGIVAPGGDKAWLKKLGLKRAELACAFVKANNKKLKVTLAWKVAKKGEKVQRGAALKFNK